MTRGQEEEQASALGRAQLGLSTMIARPDQRITSRTAAVSLPVIGDLPAYTHIFPTLEITVPASNRRTCEMSLRMDLLVIAS